MFNQWRLDIHNTWRRPLVVLAAAVVLTGCSVPGLWHYESADSAAGSVSGAFDATTYVDGIWADRVLPAVADNAVDAPTLLAAIAADEDAAVAEYGVPSAATGGAPSFLIKGEGEVVEVDTDNPNGPVTVQIGPDQVQLVTGPVIVGTALRDAVGFISFSDFTNQIDYAAVGTGLNTKVKTDVVAPVAVADLTGKTVAFEGAFTLSPLGIQIVPTQLVVS